MLTLGARHSEGWTWGTQFPSQDSACLHTWKVLCSPKHLALGQQEWTGACRGGSCRKKMGSQPLAVFQYSPNWKLMKSVCWHKLVGPPAPHYPPLPQSLTTPRHTFLLPSLGQPLAVQSNMKYRYEWGNLLLARLPARKWPIPESESLPF